ncbi:MAG: T9SS type A sorting domain-containing protein [Bacteroidetes bacterium]|nr:T9SS type A sorting domain-containing protein [Bacteroidota bacterium]
MVHTYPNKPPIPYAGLPGGNNCTSCHNGSVNTGSGKLSIKFSDSTHIYQFDSTYQVTIELTQAGINTFGFEMAVIDTNYNTIGKLTTTNPNNTYIITAGAKSYAGHKNAAINNKWVVNWKAQNNYAGKVIIGCAGLAANSNGRDNGDHTYTTFIELEPSRTNIGLQTTEMPWGKMTYMQQGNQFEFRFSHHTSEGAMMELYNMAGELIKSQQVFLQAGENNISDSFELSPGIYFAKIEAASGRYMTKLFAR